MVTFSDELERPVEPAAKPARARGVKFADFDDAAAIVTRSAPAAEPPDAGAVRPRPAIAHAKAALESDADGRCEREEGACGGAAKKTKVGGGSVEEIFVGALEGPAGAATLAVRVAGMAFYVNEYAVVEERELSELAAPLASDWRFVGTASAATDFVRRFARTFQKAPALYKTDKSAAGFAVRVLQRMGLGESLGPLRELLERHPSKPGGACPWLAELRAAEEKEREEERAAGEERAAREAAEAAGKELATVPARREAEDAEAVGQRRRLLLIKFATTLGERMRAFAEEAAPAAPAVERRRALSREDPHELVFTVECCRCDRLLMMELAAERGRLWRVFSERAAPVLPRAAAEELFCALVARPDECVPTWTEERRVRKEPPATCLPLRYVKELFMGRAASPAPPVATPLRAPAAAVGWRAPAETRAPAALPWHTDDAGGGPSPSLPRLASPSAHRPPSPDAALEPAPKAARPLPPAGRGRPVSAMSNFSRYPPRPTSGRGPSPRAPPGSAAAYSGHVPATPWTRPPPPISCTISGREPWR